MKIKGITDVFFDLDHTLWDFDTNSALTFQKIFKKNNITVHLPEFLTYYEPINLKYWKLYREEKVDKPTLRFNRLNDAFKAVQVNVSAQKINTLATDYIKYLTQYNNLCAGALQVLQYLKPNYNLHIITNGFQEVQSKKLQESGIGHFFNTVTNSESVGVKKPNPIIFKHAIKQAQTKKKLSIMIGDNLEADVMGAKNYGMNAVFYNPNKKITPPNIIQISKLIALKNYL